ncbi:protein-disulfide isomerase [Thalassotalea marina]|uniref:Protein-disulfide isomerase n=1 Tax=Thalassotalea marina TaxID=1673741 RepID=A0A919EN23_9GAMM|nr:protein-disulfide isomerase [Thalassotalea marina]GHG00940.1 hypothetical protein GCM10017161_31930 [Thalassotalea marina]
MALELYFIYDSHCPWSYAATPLLNAVAQARSDINIHTLHACHFDGDFSIDNDTINQVKALSNVEFSNNYMEQCDKKFNATLVANVMSWVEQKAQGKSLTLLNAIQKAIFVEGKALQNVEELSEIIEAYKLSPPGKCLKTDAMAKEAEFALGDIDEIQQIIGTQAIPALLLAVDDELVLLNHNLYIGAPEKIVEAIALELGE